MKLLRIRFPGCSGPQVKLQVKSFLNSRQNQPLLRRSCVIRQLEVAHTPALKFAGILQPDSLAGDNEVSNSNRSSMANTPPISAQLSKPVPGRRFDHLFFTGIILLLIGIVFLGFAHSYYLAGILRAPLKSPILQIH